MDSIASLYETVIAKYVAAGNADKLAELKTKLTVVYTAGMVTTDEYTALMALFQGAATETL
ncbi:MAG: hypothetical protein H6Q60_1150 [Oscillospiraceae bacterium]|nr:hypothetical protein [Oscillospiraceae bacterium]